MALALKKFSSIWIAYLWSIT